MELRRRAIPTIRPVDPGHRNDPKVRRQMSGPALRSFLQVAAIWELSTEEQRALLGWPPESTFYKYKAGQVGTLPFDMLMRISLLLGIFKALRILYPDKELADRWVRLPNTNPLFGGRPALALMTEGGMDALYTVRRLLDARRGAGS